MNSFLLTIFSFCLTNIAFAQNYSFDTAFINNHQKITVRTKEIKEDFVLLTVFCNSKRILSDTLDKGGLVNLEYIDFNKDKSKDILLTYMGNNPTYFLYLFDNKTNSFKDVKGFGKFPEAIQLKTNSKYYYSYHRAGCADLNWVSDLFVIDNFKAIQKGHIYGQACVYEVKTNPQIIEIYKIINNNENNKKVIGKLPLLKYIPNFGDKWDFIEKYWNKNYLEFQ
jgi:hypothetical protein